MRGRAAIIAIGAAAAGIFALIQVLPRLIARTVDDAAVAAIRAGDDGAIRAAGASARTAAGQARVAAVSQSRFGRGAGAIAQTQSDETSTTLARALRASEERPLGAPSFEEFAQSRGAMARTGAFLTDQARDAAAQAYLEYVACLHLGDEANCAD